jgi:hypothetical protein
MIHIQPYHLSFMNEAKEAFENDPVLESYVSPDEPFMALRMGEDRDCVMVYEIADDVANFVQQMQPNPLARKVIRSFAFDMEKQLKANDHKPGWEEEHWCDLVHFLERNLNHLKADLMERNSKQEIARRCANIANYAMMIADNEGEHL